MQASLLPTSARPVSSLSCMLDLAQLLLTLLCLEATPTYLRGHAHIQYNPPTTYNPPAPHPPTLSGFTPTSDSVLYPLAPPLAGPARALEPHLPTLRDPQKLFLLNKSFLTLQGPHPKT